MTGVLLNINSFIWSTGLVSIIILTGIIFTIRLKGAQFRLFRDLAALLKNRHLSAGRSNFKTVSLALGTSMGTGNIVGVASALSIGGPGAIFWMWISAFLGMAVVYAENRLSSIYSRKNEKGPMAYIKNGLKAPWLASFFAAACIGAAFGMGGMVQVNSVVGSIGSMPQHKYYIAIAAFILIYLVISGGAERIGSAAILLLPAVTIFYTVCCIAVILLFRQKLPEAIGSVFHEAFSFRGAAGGLTGYAVTAGVKRGIFSNEAGLGSSPLVHSSAANFAPGVQETFAMFEVFVDTILCCTLTAAAILCASPDGSADGAFTSLFGDLTSFIMTLMLMIFSFCTIIGWYYCGETSFLFLSKKSGSQIFPVIFAAAAASGAVFSSEPVWLISDIFNGLMALPNLTALLLLRKEIRKE